VRLVQFRSETDKLIDAEEASMDIKRISETFVSNPEECGARRM